MSGPALLPAVRHKDFDQMFSVSFIIIFADEAYFKHQQLLDKQSLYIKYLQAW